MKIWKIFRFLNSSSPELSLNMYIVGHISNSKKVMAAWTTVSSKQCRYGYHGREKLNALVSKNLSKKFSTRPISMIQNIFESPSLRLSNALWIICFRWFLDLSWHFELLVFFGVVRSLQKHKNRNISIISLTALIEDIVPRRLM